MLNGHHNLDREHGIELVAYMYGELDLASRNAFESHLVGCDECAIELASFADARLGVIEWRREDFDPLATPVILLPESEPISVLAEKRTTVGIFAGLWESLLSWPAFARGGIGLAAAALVAGVVYFAAFSGRVSNDVAETKTEQLPAAEKTEQIQPAQKMASVVDQEATAEPKKLVPVKFKKSIDQRFSPRVQLASARTSDRAPAMVRRNQPKTQVATKKTLRLNNLDEEEDNSLRLADLFAEIGKSEE